VTSLFTLLTVLTRVILRPRVTVVFPIWIDDEEQEPRWDFYVLKGISPTYISEVVHLSEDDMMKTFAPSPTFTGGLPDFVALWEEREKVPSFLRSKHLLNERRGGKPDQWGRDIAEVACRDLPEVESDDEGAGSAARPSRAASALTSPNKSTTEPARKRQKLAIMKKLNVATELASDISTWTARANEVLLTANVNGGLFPMRMVIDDSLVQVDQGEAIKQGKEKAAKAREEKAKEAAAAEAEKAQRKVTKAQGCSKPRPGPSQDLIKLACANVKILELEKEIKEAASAHGALATEVACQSVTILNNNTTIKERDALIKKQEAEVLDLHKKVAKLVATAATASQASASYAGELKLWRKLEGSGRLSASASGSPGTTMQFSPLKNDDPGSFPLSQMRGSPP
jgi:hypothetical protein